MPHFLKDRDALTQQQNDSIRKHIEEAVAAALKPHLESLADLHERLTAALPPKEPDAQP